MDETEEIIQQQLSKAADDLCLEVGKVIKLESNQQYGYYFRITLKEEKILRNKKHYTILDSNKAGVRFRNNKLNELNDDFIAAKNKYLDRQKEVIGEIVAIAGLCTNYISNFSKTSINLLQLLIFYAHAAGYSETVRSIGGVLACLDVLTAFASAAVGANKVYVRPKMMSSEDGILDLIQVRHPCLEMQQGVDYIANDVNFKRGKCNISIQINFLQH